MQAYLRATEVSIEVSIIIPIYNKEPYLRACIQSVLDQSLRATEIICINDGSNDASRSILSDAALRDPRVRVIDNGCNLGAANARNSGLDIAIGEFVQFVDADDLLPPCSTEVLLKKARQTGAEVVRGSLAIFDLENFASPQTLISVENHDRTTFKAEPSLWIPYWHTSYLISTNLIRRNGIVYPELRRGEDPVFMASVLVNAHQISLIRDIVYFYRKYPKTTGSAATSFDDVKDTLIHASRVKELYTSHHSDSWTNGYAPYLLADLTEFLSRCNLDVPQTAFVASETHKIWGINLAPGPATPY